jgi:hypothetical protein
MMDTYKAEDLKNICLDSFPEADTGEKVSFCVEVRVPADHGGNYLVKKRFRTPAEIYRQLHKKLDISVCKCGHEWKPKQWDATCPKCKAGTDDRVALIDEYDTSCHHNGDENKVIAPRDWHHVRTAVYCNVGGNEGYSVYVTLHLTGPWGRGACETKAIDVYRIKSFAGMRHCHNLVERIMKLCGTWPEHCKD